MNTKRQKEGKFGHAVYTYRGRCLLPFNKVINVTPNLSDFESRHVLKTYCPYFNRSIMLKEYIPPYIHSLRDYDLV